MVEPETEVTELEAEPEDNGPAMLQPLALPLTRPLPASRPGGRGPEAPPVPDGGENPAGDLLIGLGNTLRGDDGVGPYLAQWAQALWPALRVRCVQQLTPELAEDLAPARRVLFLDAWRLPPGPVAMDPAPRSGWVAIPPVAEARGGKRSTAVSAGWAGGPCEPVLHSLPPALAGVESLAEAGAFSHRLDPPQLLAITALLHARAPRAWLLLVPGFRFGHGEGLSAGLQTLLPMAEALLECWCSGEEAIDGASECRYSHDGPTAGDRQGQPLI